MPGPAPKPTALKLLAGNPGRRPINRREPLPRSTAAPRCPEYLDDTARREWHRIVRAYRQVGLVTALDRGALAGLCAIYSRAVLATEQLNKTGLIIKTTNGNIIQNPLVGIANKAWGEYLRFAQEFGLTPASRTRIQAPEETDEDEFLTFMAGAMNKANYG